MKNKKIVQGTYISIETKRALTREAERQGTHPTTIASEILEKEAKKILRKELYNGKEQHEQKDGQ